MSTQRPPYYPREQVLEEDTQVFDSFECIHHHQTCCSGLRLRSAPTSMWRDVTWGRVHRAAGPPHSFTHILSSFQKHLKKLSEWIPGTKIKTHRFYKFPVSPLRALHCGNTDLTRSKDVPHPIAIGRTTISRTLCFTLGHRKGPQCEGKLIRPSLPSALPSFQLWNKTWMQTLCTQGSQKERSGNKPLTQLEPLWFWVAGHAFLPAAGPAVTQPPAPAVCTRGLECTVLSGATVPDKYQWKLPTDTRGPKSTTSNEMWQTEAGMVLPFHVRSETILFQPWNSALCVVATK